jgi:hypothetical protein
MASFSGRPSPASPPVSEFETPMTISLPDDPSPPASPVGVVVAGSEQPVSVAATPNAPISSHYPSSIDDESIAPKAKSTKSKRTSI